MSISSLALVHPNARIGRNVVIDAFATIDEDTTIGDDSWIASHAHVINGATIGKSCKIYQGAVIGSDPQDLKYGGEKTTLEIGDHVTIREYCTINRGTKAAGTTTIGDHSLIMAYAHVAHDCQIDNHVVLANGVNLAGHVEIGEYAIVGGMTAVQQFLSIGRHSFIGGGTLIRKDVPPYVKAAREPLSYMGVNTIGLGRRGYKDEDLGLLQDIYRSLFIKHRNISVGLEELKKQFSTNTPYVQEIISFVEGSRHGVIRGSRDQD